MFLGQQSSKLPPSSLQTPAPLQIHRAENSKSFRRCALDCWWSLQNKRRWRKGCDEHQIRSKHQRQPPAGDEAYWTIENSPSLSTWLHLICQFNILWVDVILPLTLPENPGQNCARVNSDSHVYGRICFLLYVSGIKGKLYWLTFTRVGSLQR